MEQDTRAGVPERFIASRLPYEEVERRVREGFQTEKNTIEISADGYWVINGEKTEHKATGSDGKGIASASIENGALVLKYTDGKTAKLGTVVGDNGYTPYIQDGYWYINGENLGVKAEYSIDDYPVQSVNGKAGDVHLTASDVGARPNTWLPTVEQIGARPDTWMPTAEQVGARPSAWTPTYSDVGADKSGTAASSVSTHNTNTESHNDIRVELKALADRIAAVLDSDDTTLDELSEIVAYIKSNKSLIDSITTSKVNVKDIINNLTTNVINKPLSAAQGVALKALIDALALSVDGLGDSKLDASALTSAINTALAQAKASGEFDGKDGVSVTHSWNGTVLTITSASGTSSADLKGANGNSDYVFVNSIEECTDTSKKYVLPDGYIYAYRSTEKEVYTNILDTVGYVPNKRINSSGVIKDVDPDVCDITGYIPCKDGDIIRIENMEIPYTYTAGKYWNLLAAYDANKTYLSQMFLVLTDEGAYGYRLDAEAENGNISKFTVKDSVLGANVAYIIINAKNITDDSEVYVNTTTVTTMEWVNTGEKYNATGDTDTTDEVPEYWISELTTKADTIQQIMETAGSKKSAFLWYTDAHWQNNSKVSPALLKYLAKNTPMNKVNFGGDIICDPNPYNHENIKYAYEWRTLVADLPNHHSVYGNHDLNHLTTDVSNIAYSVLLASEETPNMVVGGDSYYYIDYPSEKTRYLYLSFLSGNHNAMTAQGEFIVDALKTVQSGWHIVVIAHRWYQYNSSTDPTVGFVPNYEGDILSVFDAYNARKTRYASNYFNTQDFSDAKGKVEFCIGGHIHVDYNFKTAGGIPVILTASDANQERSPNEKEDYGTLGTITESAVYGIIADYTDVNNTKITVVGVGRGCLDAGGIVTIVSTSV